jgi:hypothetical protein
VSSYTTTAKLPKDYKHLLPDIKTISKKIDPLSTKSGNYYNAILQNLFFATLNRPINERAFVSPGDKSFQGKNEHYGIKILYRDDNKETGFNGKTFFTRLVLNSILTLSKFLTFKLNIPAGRLLFKPVRKKAGMGTIRFMVSGEGLLSKEVK